MTRVRELTLKLLDDALPEAEWAELDALLRDAAGRDEHLALLELEAALRGLRDDFDLGEAVVAEIRGRQADRTAAAVMADLAVRPAPPWARPRRRWAGVAAVAAVAAALLVGVFVSRPDPDPTPAPNALPAFALLTRFSGEVELIGPGGEVLTVEPGRAFAAGAAVRTIGDDSAAVVELADRTRVEIEPDSTVSFPAEGPRVVLSQGQLRAEVPDRAGEPMVVRTPGADVLSRGGSFVISSAGWDSVRVEPSFGSVQLIRADAPNPVAVEAGRAAVARAGPDPVQFEAGAPVLTVPARALSFDAFPGLLHAVHAPNGRDIYAATAKRFVRWTPDGGTADAEFAPRRGNDGHIARFSPDGTALVTQRNERDETLTVRDAPDWAERVVLPGRVTEPRFLTVAPGAAWVATALPHPMRNGFSVWDGRTGALRFTRAVENDAACFAPTPDGRAVAVGVLDTGRGVNNKVVFFDAVTGERLFALPTQRKPITALAFAPDGRTLAVAFTGLIQVWDVAARELVHTVGSFERVPTCLAFSSAGRLAAGMGDGQVWVWPPDLGPAVQRFQAGNRGVRTVHFAADGRSLVAATNRAPVTVWDVAP